MAHQSSTLSSSLIAPLATAQALVVGDIINGVGIPIDSEVLSITDLGSGHWKIEIDKLPVLQGQPIGETVPNNVYMTGNHDPYTPPSGAFSFQSRWITKISIFRPPVPAPTLSFSESAGGWVSFKSFGQMEGGVSLANDYYTFKQGKLWLHHQETDANGNALGRNTFYDEFTSSTVDVILNQDPSSVKVFNTLNYEGSQSKVNKFQEESLDLVFQPAAVKYNDQEYYNLQKKSGWHVYSIDTNKEQGYVTEFLEKEGKWFNGINKLVDTEGVADTSDFTFQGIGVVANVKVLDAPRTNPPTQIGWTLELDLKRLNVSLQVGDYIYNRKPEQQLVPGSAGSPAAFDPSGGITEDQISLGDLEGKDDLVGVLRRISQIYAPASDSYKVLLDVEAVNNIFNTIGMEAGQFLMFSKYDQSMGNVIGYYARAKFVNDSTEKAEIFSVGSEIIINSK